MQIIFYAETINGKDVVLPFHYQSALQGVIYRFNTNPAFARFLHDSGYQSDKRIYRLFCFSNILQKPQSVRKSEKKFVFPSEISWIVSTVENRFADALYEAFFQDTYFNLAGNQMRLSKIKVLPEAGETPLVVKTMSPVCAYSTAVLSNGKKRTIYYRPGESAFSHAVKQNLLRKYTSYYGTDPHDTDFEAVVLSQPQRVVMEYRGFIIIGHHVELRLEGSAELIQMSLDAGLGSKNAQGCGLILPKNQIKEV